MLAAVEEGALVAVVATMLVAVVEEVTAAEATVRAMCSGAPVNVADTLVKVEEVAMIKAAPAAVVSDSL